MVHRPLQKLGGNSLGDSEFNSYVSYFLTLIKIISILICTHHMVSFVPQPWLVMSEKMEDSIHIQIFRSSSHQLIIGAIAYNGL